MKSVNYSGSVPKTLRSYCDKHADKIAEAHAGGGYTTDSGFAYDVMLRNGWRDGGDLVHTIIEPTIRETLDKLRSIVPCDCEDCQKGNGP